MIVFLHGKESGPGGTKARWLAARYGAVCPALDTSTVEGALDQARHALRAHTPALVVGSSFGGGLAVALAAEGLWAGPSVLIAPAHALMGLATALPATHRAIVLHGTDDDVVPLAHAEALCARSPGARLVRIEGGDHRLNRVLDDGTLAGALEELGAVSR